MKLIEIIKESDVNFDSKHINNICNKVIDNKIIEQIENQGVTIEQIETLFKDRVFIYKTQITLHGLFEGYFNGIYYKNMILNKNKSLGVKYTAIDFKKKQILRDVFQTYSRTYNKQAYERFDSTGLSLDLALDYNEDNKKKAIEILNNIDHFIGTKKAGVYRCFIENKIYIKVFLSAIYEKNIFKFVESFLNYTKEQYYIDMYECVEKGYNILKNTNYKI
jgi:hypothetical protein